MGHDSGRQGGREGGREGGRPRRALFFFGVGWGWRKIKRIDVLEPDNVNHDYLISPLMLIMVILSPL